jgi:hypothetical protein
VEPVVVASEPWQGWKGVDQMLSWSLESGTVRCEQHFRNSLRQIVDGDLGGRLTKANWSTACELFYHQRQRRMAEKVAA